MNLELRVRGVLIKYMNETPIAACQSMTPIDHQWWHAQARVLDTIQLRVWLRSLDTAAVVDAPLQLRLQMKREAAELVSLYADAN